MRHASKNTKVIAAGAGVALLVALLFILVPTLAEGRQPPPVSETVANYTPPPRMEPPLAVVIGDSQSNGNTGVTAQSTWVSKGLRAAGYAPYISGHGGTGFAHALPGDAIQDPFPSFSTALKAREYNLPERQPGLLVFQGGGNDGIYTDAEITAAATEAVRLGKERYPDAQVLIIGPLNQGGQPDSRRESTSEVLRNVATSNGALYVDATDWFTKNDMSSHLLADGAHVVQAGHDILAGELEAAVRGLDIADPEQVVVSP